MIKNKFLLLLFLLLIGVKGYGQCPPGDVMTFITQMEVDSFLINYPNCVTYSGDININDVAFFGDPIFNLYGLQNLETINGFLRIYSCDSLANLSGLEGITSIDGNLSVLNNLILQNLTGLDSLVFLGGYLTIDQNDNLQNINALGNLVAVEERFNISENNNLQYLGDLDNLSSVGNDFAIHSNASLQSLGSFENLTSIGGFLSIFQNDSLQNLNGLESLSLIGESMTISGNHNLVSISSLNNLYSVGDHINIINNSSLQTLRGLENLTVVNSSLRISNHNLESLEGLENITSVGGDLLIGYTNIVSLTGLTNVETISGDLFIDHNRSLQNFTGIESLTSVSGGMRVEFNDSLQTFTGLDGLTSISGDVLIWINDNLQNLSGIGNLASIGGNLHIGSNDKLLNVNGLEKLVSVNGHISISSNDQLLDLNGLEMLTSVGDFFRIYGHYYLDNLDSFESLITVGGSLEILSNDNLQSLSGLGNLTSIGSDLYINNNDDLQTLNGLENVVYIGGDLKINNNDELSLCHIPSVCDYFDYGSGEIIIENNGPFCSHESSVLSRCGDLGKITFLNYYDLNQNGIQELLDEPFLSNSSVLIEPGGYKIYSNGKFGGVKHLYYGDYTVSFNEDDLPDWNLTSSISTYNSTLNDLNNSDTIIFGAYPANFFSKVFTHCIVGLARCNEFGTIEVFAINEGTTTITDGTLWFDVDPEVLAIAHIDTPDTLVGDHKMGWHFTNLYPGQTVKREISIQFPGPPDFPIGNFLNFSTQIDFTDINGQHSNEPSIHRVEVQCSYDPNDKLVFPQYPENYALIDEDLIYTIRFQNTGNAEAYDVVIKDLLSENLDLSTFKYITSSHEEVLSTFLNDRMLTFEFKDIFLPDSTTNFEESQGYVMYSIQANSDIDENTNIENTANIFFDYNPAVVTNTTENTMLSTFDFDEDGFNLWEDCDDNNVLVNADAIDIPNNGIDEDCDGEDAIVATKEIVTIQPQIFPNPTTSEFQIIFPNSIQGTYELRTISGKLIYQGKLHQQTTVNLERQTEGIYILLMKTDKGVWAERVVKL